MWNKTLNFSFILYCDQNDMRTLLKRDQSKTIGIFREESATDLL